MKTNIQKNQGFWVMVLALLLVAGPAFADNNEQDLKKEIAELKAKVAELEAKQNSPAVPNQPSGVIDSSWDPFAEMQRMDQEMGRMFDHAFSQPLSSQNGMFTNRMFFNNSQIENTKDGYVIKFNISGFDKDKIDINVDEHSISISGEYKGEEKQQNSKAVFESHSYGKFLNTIPLPKDADTTKMKTEKEGDQLKIFLPKKK